MAGAVQNKDLKQNSALPSSSLIALANDDTWRALSCSPIANSNKAQQSSDSLSTALDSQPPLPPSRRLGLGVGCRQSLLRRSARTLNNVIIGGVLTRYSLDRSLFNNNMLD
eukprot:scaffold119163_cov36-Cyclotella_meneghiniana.AAC.1